MGGRWDMGEELGENEKGWKMRGMKHFTLCLFFFLTCYLVFHLFCK